MDEITVDAGLNFTEELSGVKYDASTTVKDLASNITEKLNAKKSHKKDELRGSDINQKTIKSISIEFKDDKGKSRVLTLSVKSNDTNKELSDIFDKDNEVKRKLEKWKRAKSLKEIFSLEKIFSLQGTKVTVCFKFD